MSKTKKKKKRELKNFKPDEVSFVARGANMKQHFLIKNETGEIGMSKSLIEKLKDFKFADEAKTEKALDELCQKEGLNDEQRESLKTAMAVMETMGSEGNVRGFSFNTDEGYASVSVYKAEKSEEEIAKEAEEAKVAKEAEEAKIAKDEEDRIAKEAEAAKVAKEAEEGSAKEDIPVAVQKRMDEQDDKIRKFQEKSDADDAKIAKDADEKVEKEFIQKADDDLKHLGDSKELGLLLKKCSEVLDEANYGKLEGILKSTSTRIEKGDLFKEIGENHSMKSDLDGEALVDAKAEEIQKANPSMSIQKARDTARKQITKDKKSNK